MDSDNYIPMKIDPIGTEKVKSSALKEKMKTDSRFTKDLSRMIQIHFPKLRLIIFKEA